MVVMKEIKISAKEENTIFFCIKSVNSSWPNYYTLLLISTNLAEYNTYQTHPV